MISPHSCALWAHNLLNIEVDNVELLSKMTICAFSLASELVRAHTSTECGQNVDRMWIEYSLSTGSLFGVTVSR